MNTEIDVVDTTNQKYLPDPDNPYDSDEYHDYFFQAVGGLLEKADRLGIREELHDLFDECPPICDEGLSILTMFVETCLEPKQRNRAYKTALDKIQAFWQ